MLEVRQIEIYALLYLCRIGWSFVRTFQDLLVLYCDHPRMYFSSDYKIVELVVLETYYESQVSCCDERSRSISQYLVVYCEIANFEF